MGLQILSNIVLTGLSSDPGSPADGELWYNSTDEKLKFNEGTLDRTLLSEELLATSAGAGMIGVLDTDGNFGTATVEAVLDEIVDDYALQTAGNGASKIGVQDAGSLLGGADDLESVLAALGTRINTLETSIDWIESVDVAVHYLKTDASGAPAGGSGETAGELCYNTSDNKYYIYTTSWDAGTSLGGGRACFAFDGTGSGFSGTVAVAPDHKVYVSGAVVQTPDDGATAFFSNLEVFYTYDADASPVRWKKFFNFGSHNNVAGLQGGTSAEYYHLTSAQHTIVANLGTANSSGDGATNVGVEDSGSIFTATDVEGVLDEMGAIVQVLANTANGEGASLIGVEDANSRYTGTDLETILDEIGLSISSAADTYTAGATTVANGTFNITHNLNSTKVLFQAFDDNSTVPENAVMFAWKIIDANTIQIDNQGASADYHFIVSTKE